MTELVEIILLGPPMQKERVKATRFGGQLYTPERTVAFEGRLALAAQQAMAGRDLLTGPLKLEMVVVKPVPKSWPKKRKAAALSGEERPTNKPDYDNYAKILDALNLVVWVDDALVVKGTTEKHYGERPLTAVRVMPLEEPEPIPAWVTRHFEEGVFG